MTKPLWRHKRRGTMYSEMGRGILQHDNKVVDETEVVVYMGEDGRIWVRPVKEFEDGRFERM